MSENGSAHADRLRRGKEICRKVYGNVLQVPDETGGDAYTELTLTNLFNDILGRDHLSMRDKRWIILGAIAGLGANPSLFEIHARSSLGNDEMTTEDLYEFILLVSAYVGHPRTTPLKAVVDKLIAENKEKRTEATL